MKEVHALPVLVFQSPCTADGFPVNPSSRYMDTIQKGSQSGVVEKPIHGRTMEGSPWNLRLVNSDLQVA
jgi:hypothetical protein